MILNCGTNLPYFVSETLPQTLFFAFVIVNGSFKLSLSLWKKFKIH